MDIIVYRQFALPRTLHDVPSAALTNPWTGAAYVMQQLGPHDGVLESVGTARLPHGLAGADSAPETVYAATYTLRSERKGARGGTIKTRVRVTFWFHLVKGV